MTTGRLSRQELGWLLAQEARGAAKALRENVSQLSPPILSSEEQADSPPVHTTLDALDDAIQLLGALQSAPPPGRSRRGRIDLAALLYDLAPETRIAIEPGAGTEVFGDEGELRRLLHVLVARSSPGGPSDGGTHEVRIRRQDDWVRISVELGPDASTGLELERRWLSRMATRLGGHLELEGGTESVLLPADASAEQREVADLRKELEQAQRLGAIYAQELASAIRSDAPEWKDSRPERPPHPLRDGLGLLAATTRAFAAALRPLVQAYEQDAEVSAAARLTSAERLAWRAQAARELLDELGRVGACALDGPVAPASLAELLRAACRDAEPRASRQGVRLELHAADDTTAEVRSAIFSLMARCLVDHAIAATPRGGRVLLSLGRGDAEIQLLVEDGGPSVPRGAGDALIGQTADPASLGRPAGIGLLVAREAAAHLGAAMDTETGGQGGFRVCVRLPGTLADQQEQ